jgi:nucleotide-binding universal stress UspA family protein
MNEVRTILLTTDFSDTSLEAFPAAVTLAQRFGAKIVVAHVEDDRFPPLLVEYMAVGLEDIRKRQHAECVERLSEYAKAHLAVPYEIEVALGIPHVEIVQLAERHHADLIVMATHGRGFISHAVMGSTTERVLRRTPCPVLVVRGTAGS